MVRRIMSTAVVTSKGQITIPAAVRHRMGLEAGDRVEFVELASGEFAIKPAVQDLTDLKGLLKKPKLSVSVENMRDAVRRRGMDYK